MTIGAEVPQIDFGPSGVAESAMSRLLPRALDLGERILVVATFGFFVVANLLTHNPVNIVVGLLTDLVTVVIVLMRKPAYSISLSPLDWALAIVGTAGPMLARPGGAPLVGVTGPMMFWAVGMAISLAAKLSLNRRFGVAPANRGVQAHGAYAFIRHPMYAGYALMNGAYLLLNPTPHNLIVYAVAWSCQLGRINREERWLRRDGAYRAYAKSVPFRFIPFVI